jgi:hypothetical protein
MNIRRRMSILLLLALGASPILTLADEFEIHGIFAWVDIPRSVQVGDAVTLKVTVENVRDSEDFDLDCVILEGDFLGAFRLESMKPQPAETEEYSDELYLMYPMKIAPGDSVVFAFELVAVKAGVYTDAIYIDGETESDLHRWVQIKVVE